ncbi:urea ABC transporter permease subunit UrtB [Pacificibacter marinus]|uniref:High-affinity branched-chain amino acid transport system permease protein LivH n=1 Tax=Pacificibacter marinus TaxID=658057 RepID=A0A1Y5TUW9_9RHOB|nr:urea ABC transporter permease subunit UrtB [Pacificibacter marinus]SEL35524.1 amino acid/amide ABC transporter membrane protein 1, HAAT family [Pacificibacter marinus]SLN68874.1 High-affinity branched-chain amino acid transport system permease protein LivH [Pacificibacter marinus]
MIRFLSVVFMLIMTLGLAAQAQDANIQDVLQEHREAIEKSSRKTIAPAIDAIAASGLPSAQTVLQKWQSKDMWQRKSDGQFFYAEKVDSKTYTIFAFEGGTPLGDIAKADLDQLKPNSGIRAMIGAALVQFQLNDPDPVRRQEAILAIQRDGEASHLAPLRASIASEADPDIKALKEVTERLLTISYDTDDAARVTAIQGFNGALSLEARAALNPVLSTKITLKDSLPETANIKRKIIAGSDALSVSDAFDMLVASGVTQAQPTVSERKDALAANIVDGKVGGVAVADLNTQDARDRAYQTLAEAGTVPAWDAGFSEADAVKSAAFVEVYDESSKAVTDAAEATLKTIDRAVGLNQTLDLALDGLSLASIYFLAAIGLAITFGVMGVINMAHGEFIMMGAYTGYVVQQIIPDYTLSIIVAIPAAFMVTFAAGVAMERLIIRWLYNRPLETLLASFGVAIALQQIAKNIFGTQARPLTSPAWLDGALVFNDVLAISYIRIAIFVLAGIFLAVFLFIMKKTRLGLETRAVTQNPRMAASMGINPDRVNMLTFGLGSGIAGIAGVAIGLYAKVTSEMGADYIVQSFMTVVVGGVGNIWGTLLGALGIGFLQKGIEWLNPSNTLAAQTYMIVFIIIFIQFRPKGIIALKGRAAGD